MSLDDVGTCGHTEGISLAMCLPQRLLAAV